jgi:hypothetical protein
MILITNIEILGDDADHYEECTHHLEAKTEQYNSLEEFMMLSLDTILSNDALCSSVVNKLIQAGKLPKDYRMNKFFWGAYGSAYPLSVSMNHVEPEKLIFYEQVALEAIKDTNPKIYEKIVQKKTKKKLDEATKKKNAAERAAAKKDKKLREAKKLLEEAGASVELPNVMPNLVTGA